MERAKYGRWVGKLRDGQKDYLLGAHPLWEAFRSLYNESLCLTENARLVLTDSGGLQEESTYFRTPCLTLRPNTERPVTATVSSNKLTHPERLRLDINEVLNCQQRFGQVPALRDGRTAERVVKSLLEFNYEGKQCAIHADHQTNSVGRFRA